MYIAFFIIKNIPTESSAPPLSYVRLRFCVLRLLQITISIIFKRVDSDYPNIQKFEFKNLFSGTI